MAASYTPKQNPIRTVADLLREQDEERADLTGEDPSQQPYKVYSNDDLRSALPVTQEGYPEGWGMDLSRDPSVLRASADASSDASGATTTPGRATQSLANWSADPSGATTEQNPLNVAKRLADAYEATGKVPDDLQVPSSAPRPVIKENFEKYRVHVPEKYPEPAPVAQTPRAPMVDVGYAVADPTLAAMSANLGSIADSVPGALAQAPKGVDVKVGPVQILSRTPMDAPNAAVASGGGVSTPREAAASAAMGAAGPKAYETKNTPTPPDLAALLREAQRRRREDMLKAAIWDAGETASSGIIGRKADRGFTNQLRQYAESHLTDAATQGKLAQDAYAAKVKALADDPAFVKNRRFQDLVTKDPGLLGYLGGEDSVRGLSEPDLQKGIAMYQAKVAADRLANKDAADAARAAETSRHNKATEALLRARLNRASSGAGGLDPRSQAVANRFVATGLQKLGEKTSKGASEFVAALQGMEKVFPGITDGATKGENWNIANDYGFGQRALGNLPGGSNFQEQNAKNFETAYRQAKELLIRSRTGAVINDSEFKAQAQALYDQIADDPTQLPYAMATLKNLFYQKLADLQRGYQTGDPNTDVLSRYQGLKYTDPMFDRQRGVEARKEVGGRRFIKVGGQWMEE